MVSHTWEQERCISGPAGQCTAGCANTLSLLAWEAVAYGCGVLWAISSSFFGSSHLPDLLLGMILHKSMASKHLHAVTMAFHRKEAVLKHSKFISKADHFFFFFWGIWSAYLSFCFFVVSHMESGDMEFGNEDVSGTLYNCSDGTTPFILSSHLFILLATCCKGHDIYSQGITGVCDAAYLAMLPAGCAKACSRHANSILHVCLQQASIRNHGADDGNEFTDVCQT